MHAMSTHKAARAGYAQRLVARGGGFRAATLLAWPIERLAREIVRLNAEKPEDELDLLQLLYVDVEPQIQAAFLDAAGVPHENAVIPEELDAPYATADAVQRAAMLVREQFGDDGVRYLRTIAKYNGAAWPGIEEIVAAD
jgi:hypothetical protein